MNRSASGFGRLAPQNSAATERRRPKTEADFAEITSRELAQGLEAQGKLVKVLLFPAEFGGAAIPPNVVYAPDALVEQRNRAIQSIQAWAKAGQVDKLDVRPEYKGSSFVPSKTHMIASHSVRGSSQTLTLDIW